MNSICFPSKTLALGLFLPTVFPTGIYGATTVIDLSVDSITQPFTNSTDVATNGSQFGFRVSDLGFAGANRSSGDAGNGGSGQGIFSVSNNGMVQLNSFGGGQAQGVFYQSNGGNGGNYTAENDDNNAGSGGVGGSVTGSNSDVVEANGDFATGFSPFRGESYGGNGGSAANNEGRGGNGRNGTEVVLTNSGILRTGSGDNITGGIQFRGLLGISNGGNAGSGSSGASGGSSGDVRVLTQNSSRIQLDLGSPNEPQVTSIYGILAESVRGNGADSLKKDEDGGNGGNTGSGGVSFSTVDEWEQKSRFAEGPVGIGGFDSSIPQDDVVARVAAGFQMQFTDTLSGYVQYQGEFSDSLSSNGAGVGLRVEF